MLRICVRSVGNLVSARVVGQPMGWAEPRVVRHKFYNGSISKKAIVYGSYESSTDASESRCEVLVASHLLPHVMTRSFQSGSEMTMSVVIGPSIFRYAADEQHE